MAAGTGAAMSPIALWGIYNPLWASYVEGTAEDAMALSYYIMGSTGLFALEDSAYFMSELSAARKGSFSYTRKPLEMGTAIVLIPLSTIPAAFLLLIHLQVQKEHMEATHTTKLWNEFTQYFVYTSIGFAPYLILKTWNYMRASLRKSFHGEIPNYVRDRVNALRYLEGKIDSGKLIDGEVHQLYKIMHGSVPTNVLKNITIWAKYLSKGSVSTLSKTEGLLNYLTLSSYAKAEFASDLTYSSDPSQSSSSFSRSAKALAALGIAGGLVAIYAPLASALSYFIGEEASIAIAATACVLGFVPASFIQKHGVEESLESINKSIKPFLRGESSILDILSDPIQLGKAIGKGACYTFGFFQNLLIDTLPMAVVTFFLPPNMIGGSEQTQYILGGAITALSSLYIFNNIGIGHLEMGNQLIRTGQLIQSIYRKFYSWVTKSRQSTKDAERRWVLEKLRETIGVTLTFTPEFDQGLRSLEQKFEVQDNEE